MTLEEAIICTGFTGKVFCPFEHLHKDVEEKLGRPVWTHEFGDKEFYEKVKELYKEDFKKMIKPLWENENE